MNKKFKIKIRIPTLPSYTHTHNEEKMFEIFLR